MASMREYHKVWKEKKKQAGGGADSGGGRDGYKLIWGLVEVGNWYAHVSNALHCTAADSNL